MAKQNGVTGILVATFVLLIIGAVLVGTISKEANTAVTKTRATQDFVVPKNGTTTAVNVSLVYTITNAPSGWKAADCPISAITLENSSDPVGTFVADTDYVFNTANGTFTFKNTTSTGFGGIANDNTTTLRYSYCADAYLNSDFGRTVLPLVGGFFALAILGVGLALFFQIGKQTGLINM